MEEGDHPWQRSLTTVYWSGVGPTDPTGDVNLFLVGWSPSGTADRAKARGALSTLLARLPFFDSARVESWEDSSGHCTLAWVSHEEERVGGVRYVDLDDDGMATFSGRPFLWVGDGEADGIAPLDPRFYRRPAGAWIAELDGRFAVVRYDDREEELEVYTDSLGAYPLFAGDGGGLRWISNSAELVKTALGTEEIDLAVVASLLGGGSTLSGDPIWRQVKRIPRGTVLRMRAEEPDSCVEVLPLAQIAAMAGAGFEVEPAVRDLVAATAALANWPGRPVLLQLSGGQDSRLVLAAALAADLSFEALTTGAAGAPDARVARSLCDKVGLAHRLISSDPGGALLGNPREAARVVGLASSGTVSIEYAAGYPITQTVGPLRLWLGGQAGEIARHYYRSANGSGRQALIQHLVTAFAGSAELLSRSGMQRLEHEVGRAVDTQLDAGVPPVDVSDLFFLLNRTGSLCGGGFGCVEYAKGDTITPLWSSRILRHQLAPPLRQRARKRFHTATLNALSPLLAKLPLADYTPPRPSGSNELAPLCKLVRELVGSQDSHPAWEVLERRYVEQLLGRGPRSLDQDEQRHLWRLATVFGGSGQGLPA